MYVRNLAKFLMWAAVREENVEPGHDDNDFGRGFDAQVLDVAVVFGQPDERVEQEEEGQYVGHDGGQQDLDDQKGRLSEPGRLAKVAPTALGVDVGVDGRTHPRQPLDSKQQDQKPGEILPNLKGIF